ENARYAVNLGGLQRLFKGEGRQDGGHALGQHGFAGAGRPNHENVVSASASNLERSLGGLLPPNVFEVDQESLGVAQQRVAIHLKRSDSVSGIHEMDDVEQGANGKNLHPANHGGLARIEFRHNQTRDFLSPCLDGDRQCAAHATDPTVEGQFTHEKTVTNLLLIEPSVSPQDAESHRQVETRTFFADIGGSQVDRDLSGRDIVATILERRTNTVAALAHRRVGKPNRVKVIFVHSDAGNVHFHFNDVGIDAVHGGAQGFIEHDSA